MKLTSSVLPVLLVLAELIDSNLAQEDRKPNFIVL